MPNAQTLLIVDDCPEDRKIYRRYLRQDPHQSYHILEADSAKDGLALYQERYCDLILLDFYLPDMSGLDFLEKLELELAVPTAVIMLTGQGNEGIAVQAMKQGVRDYLVKQYLKPDVLQLAVRNALKQSCLQAELCKTRERQRLITTTALRIRQSLNLEQILHTAVVEVHQLLRCDRVMVCQFIPTQGSQIVADSAKSSCELEIGDFIREFPQIGSGYEANWSEICDRLPEQFQSPASLVVPIQLSYNYTNSQPWGLLIAHHSTSEWQWQSDEVEILQQLAVQLAIAIQQAELLAQTQAALEAEKQLNAFKSQIIATVSHEYRTPLAAILASASTLKQNSNLLHQTQQQRFLQLIEDKARHMAKLVDDLLSVNQTESGKMKFQPMLLDLKQLCSESLAEQKQLASDRHQLSLHSTGDLQDFWGDRRLLRRTFGNLISNAVKYSPNGGCIEVDLKATDTQIIFSVKDKGIGIPAADRANLFKSFSRGSNVDTIPGTGLGLAIAKACIDLHGGEISLKSEVGQGTEVTVILPTRKRSGEKS
ncbi:response regulator [Chroococcidiopsis sp. FACHB-1243]|uniref:hybrid sensor histidine kinase/response regulator n=1 Tax=Chroococcidiopsis sp. [FACHB-1243] TaxID=2692781 RepID=UPI00177C96CC|nr:ATP-binding protein [Chroococcidiopsis sp. [FACHB-1243]]MBD2307666.1 response regulator [Chroococcidiopsis sp. [FACHB-1243]]